MGNDNYSYLTYGEFVDFGGQLDLQSFNGYNYIAQSTVDYYTFNRIIRVGFCELPKGTQFAIKQCIIKLIELLRLRDNTIGVTNSATTDLNNVVSQSNDGVSVTYNAMPSEEAIVHIGDSIKNTIRVMLGACTLPDGRNLLYRGVYPDD